MSTLAYSVGRRRPAGQEQIAAEAARVSSVPPIETDAPNLVWAIDFQFDSTAERLVTELETASTLAGGAPKVLRIDKPAWSTSHHGRSVRRTGGRTSSGASH